MNWSQIISWYNTPSSLKQEENQLNDLLRKYPQVSLFQTLEAKRLQEADEPEYRGQLKKAAVFAPDRKKLYQFIVQPAIEKQIEKVEEELREETDLKSTSTTTQETELHSEEKTTSPAEASSERQALEQEILNHAVSSSILLDVSHVEEKDPRAEVHEEPQEELPEQKAELPENYDTLGVLDWLKSDVTPSDSGSAEAAKSTDDIISQFIKNDPKISEPQDEKSTIVKIERPRAEFFSPENVAKMSLMEDEELVTETLAGIYAKQGNISKAKAAYEKLSLKFPKKSDYFARLIKDLDKKP